MSCPKCGSTELHAEKEGFKGGQALVGGILAGTIDSKEIYLTCLKCGNKFKPGEAIIVCNSDNGLSEIDTSIVNEYNKSKSLIQAISICVNLTHRGLADAKKYTEDLLRSQKII
jgi:predicted nucleic-acid-binding Zn-ribbon protein